MVHDWMIGNEWTNPIMLNAFWAAIRETPETDELFAWYSSSTLHYEEWNIGLLSLCVKIANYILETEYLICLNLKDWSILSHAITWSGICLEREARQFPKHTIYIRKSKWTPTTSTSRPSGKILLALNNKHIEFKECVSLSIYKSSWPNPIFLLIWVYRYNLYKTW